MSDCYPWCYPGARFALAESAKCLISLAGPPSFFEMPLYLRKTRVIDPISSYLTRQRYEHGSFPSAGWHVFSETRGQSPELNFQPILREHPDCSCTCLSFCGQTDMQGTQPCFLWRDPSGSSFEAERFDLYP